MGKRDLSQELLPSVREMKAGRRGRVHRSGKSGSAMAKAKRDSLAAEARRQPMVAARDEKRKLKGVEVEMSSGNVFADLGLPDADKLKIKSGLVIEITKAVRRLGLSQAEAGRRMGLPQPKVSGLFRGEFANVSERKLMECLNRLGYDVEISRSLRPSEHTGNCVYTITRDENPSSAHYLACHAGKFFTVIFDDGTEIAGGERFTGTLDADIFFAHAYCHWE